MRPRKAMDLPSGDQRGLLSASAWSEILRMGPPAASTTKTSVLRLSSKALPVRSETKAMKLPSGDQSKVLTPFFRFVKRLASPPSNESAQTCARGVASPAAVWSAEGRPCGISVLMGVGEGEGVGGGVALPCCV